MNTDKHPETDRLAALLPIPVKELRNLAEHAGIEAIHQAIVREGKVTLPLQLHASGIQTLPIFLPASLVLFLRELCEAADIEGGADGYVLGMLEDDIVRSTESTPEFFAGAVEMISTGWDLSDREEQEGKMVYVAQQWEEGPDGTVKRKTTAAVTKEHAA